MTILLIDGQNFLKNVNKILWENEKLLSGEAPDWLSFNFNGLLEKKLEDYQPQQKRFYLSKIIKYKKTEEKSEELIERNRALKLQLEKQGFQYIIAGKVRGRLVKRMVIFDEKGVDVKIAVDMIGFSLLDKTADTIILASSDSDFQPAIAEIKKRGNTKLIYLGFQRTLNKGLIYSTDDTVKVQDKEVLAAYSGAKAKHLLN